MSERLNRSDDFVNMFWKTIAFSVYNWFDKRVRTFQGRRTQSGEHPSKMWKYPTLMVSYTGGHYVYERAVCRIQIGCEQLLEELYNNERPIFYWLRSLKNPNKAYHASQQERLQIVSSYIYCCFKSRKGGSPPRQADHDSLFWILKLTYARGRIAWQRICI